MDIIRTRARLTATTGLVTSPAVFLSAPARGSADFLAALGFTLATTSTIANIATSDADAMVMTSALATNAEIAKEETSEGSTNAATTKEETSMVKAASTMANAGRCHLSAGSESATRQPTCAKPGVSADEDRS